MKLQNSVLATSKNAILNSLCHILFRFPSNSNISHIITLDRWRTSTRSGIWSAADRNLLWNLVLLRRETFPTVISLEFCPSFHDDLRTVEFSVFISVRTAFQFSFHTTGITPDKVKIVNFGRLYHEKSSKFQNAYSGRIKFHTSSERR